MAQKYPKVSLEQALKLAEAVYKQNKECKVATAAVAAGYSEKSGTFGLIKAAAKWYKLVLEDNSLFKVTPLGAAIFSPLDANEKVSSLKEAFLSFDLFKQLFEGLPSGTDLVKERIATLAERLCGVDVDQKENFVTVFLEGATFTNILNELEEGHYIKSSISQDETISPDDGKEITHRATTAQFHDNDKDEHHPAHAHTRHTLVINVNLNVDSTTDPGMLLDLVKQILEL